MRSTLPAFLIMFIMFFISCTSTGDETADDIRSYAAQRGWSLRDTAGVLVFVEEVGQAERPGADQTVEFHYEGRYLDDSLFDTTRFGEPATVFLSSAIPGLRKALPLFGRNGKGIVFLLPSEAYGNNPPFGVQEGRVLVYAVELLDFY